MGMIEILFDATCAMFQTGKINFENGYSSLDEIPEGIEDIADGEMIAKVESGLKKKVDAKNNCGKSGLTKEKKEDKVQQVKKGNPNEKNR